MKSILRDNNEKFVSADRLTGKEFAAYATKKGDPSTGYCVITKLQNHQNGAAQYGFVNLTKVNTEPTFVGSTYLESIFLASKKRDVCTFDTYEELLTAILAKSF